MNGSGLQCTNSLRVYATQSERTEWIGKVVSRFGHSCCTKHGE